jgi:hypothetical protein
VWADTPSIDDLESSARRAWFLISCNRASCLRRNRFSPKLQAVGWDSEPHSVSEQHFLKPSGNAEALKVAKDLDAEVEALLAAAA